MVRSVAFLTMKAWLAACASGNIRPATDHVGRPISGEDIRAEMRGNSRVAYGVGLGLGGAAAGLLTGGVIGYRIDYSRDTSQQVDNDDTAPVHAAGQSV